jgi:hypothetical protein
MKFHFKRFIFVFLAIALVGQLAQTQINIDYQSTITTGNTAERLIGNGFQKLGPYSAYGRLWVFYSKGSNAVWRTKQVEPGGNWSSEQTVFQFQPNGEHKLDVDFDGSHFHFVWRNGTDLIYKRGKAMNDGTITFDQPVTVFSDAEWSVQDVDFFSVHVDSNKHIWIHLGIISGNLRKPIVLSSIDTNGAWQNRPGWPKDMQEANTHEFHGWGTTIVEIDDGNILFIWNDRVNTRLSARLWTAGADPFSEGTLGSLENTGLASEGARLSVVSPAQGIALVNSNQNVARRNSNGSWENVNPPLGLQQTFWNSMSMSDGVVRLWDIDADKNVRYRQTANNGTNWSGITTKYILGNAVQINASQVNNNSGNHHSILIATGSTGAFDPPFNLISGIEGIIPDPGIVNLSFPENDANNIPVSLQFEWGNDISISSFQLQVSRNDLFTDLVVDVNQIFDPSYTVNDLDHESTYYWRVRGVTSGGTLGDWSGTWSFVTIIEAPEAPLLLSPENGAIDVATDIDLAWNAAERASTYRVQVSTNLDFTNIIHEGIDVSDTSETVSGLEHETQYYWRVRAENIGGISNWSSVWSFTTVSTIPPAPTLSSPADSVTDQPTTITLSWNSTLMADYYQLQIATVPDFSSTFADVTNIFDTQHQVNGLDNDRTYYWRVRGINEIGAGDWSEVWNFSTGIAAPPAPVLVSPDDASVNQPVMITLDWEDTPRADIYRIQLSTVPNFSSTVINVGNLTSSSYAASGLGFSTTYYWRVNASNESGTGSWSAYEVLRR